MYKIPIFQLYTCLSITFIQWLHVALINQSKNEDRVSGFLKWTNFSFSKIYFDWIQTNRFSVGVRSKYNWISNGLKKEARETTYWHVGKPIHTYIVRDCMGLKQFWNCTWVILHLLFEIYFKTACRCFYIQILSKFYPDSIQISSRWNQIKQG